MQKSMVRIAALLALQGGTLFAQNLVGTWQGPLQLSENPKDIMRVMFKITATDAGTLTGNMYTPDFGGRTAAPDVTLKGSAVKIGMPSITATYQGQMSADGNSIAGKWKGPGPILTLNLTRATAETAWKIPEPPPPPKMMAADADPGFEVATVKPSSPDARNRGLGFRGRQFSSTNLTVSDQITFAYGIHARQIEGAPDWIDKDRYDVVGKPDVEGQPNNRQMMGLVQKLLADRFRLKIHYEKSELSVYAIVIGKTGAKLTKAEGDPKGEPALYFTGRSQFVGQNATIADFARFLERGVLADRPVVDQTGLTGRYDLALTWRPELSLGDTNSPPPPSNQDALPDVYGAFQQQLGLRVEATKTTIDVIVIDHVEKPSEN